MAGLFDKMKEGLNTAIDKADEMTSSVGDKIGSTVDSLKTKEGFISMTTEMPEKIAEYANELLREYKTVDVQGVDLRLWCNT